MSNQPSISQHSDTPGQDETWPTDGSRRHCWVCFGTEQDDKEQDVVWICPCQCKGSMKWIHEECLQRWIDEKQRRTNSRSITCSQCKAHYILSFPPANRIVRLLEKYDRLLYGSSPFVTVLIVVGSVYWSCFSYGFVSVLQVMGYDEGKRILDEADVNLLVIGLPAIPITLVLAKLIKWEDFVLKVWRQSAGSIPRPLSYLVGKPPPRARANCDRYLIEPGFNEPLGCTRLICGALVLPTVATIVGKLFFSRSTDSHWRRTLLGGLAFILIKGALKIYLRKSQYWRLSQRRIKNYGAQEGTSSDNSSDDPQSGSSSRFDNNLDVINDQFEDDDSEDQMPRTRTMFSMTISLGR